MDAVQSEILSFINSDIGLIFPNDIKNVIVTMLLSEIIVNNTNPQIMQSWLISICDIDRNNLKTKLHMKTDGTGIILNKYSKLFLEQYYNHYFLYKHLWLSYISDNLPILNNKNNGDNNNNNNDNICDCDNIGDCDNIMELYIITINKFNCSNIKNIKYNKMYKSLKLSLKLYQNLTNNKNIVFIKNASIDTRCCYFKNKIIIKSDNIKNKYEYNIFETGEKVNLNKIKNESLFTVAIKRDLYEIAIKLLHRNIIVYVNDVNIVIKKYITSVNKIYLEKIISILHAKGCPIKLNDKNANLIIKKDHTIKNLTFLKNNGLYLKNNLMLILVQLYERYIIDYSLITKLFNLGVGVDYKDENGDNLAIFIIKNYIKTILPYDENKKYDYLRLGYKKYDKLKNKRDRYRGRGNKCWKITTQDYLNIKTLNEDFRIHKNLYVYCILIQRLIDHGLDINEVNNENCNALHYALEKGNELIIDCLYENDSQYIDPNN